MRRHCDRHTLCDCAPNGVAFDEVAHHLEIRFTKTEARPGPSQPLPPLRPELITADWGRSKRRALPLSRACVTKSRTAKAEPSHAAPGQAAPRLARHAISRPRLAPCQAAPVPTLGERA